MRKLLFRERDVIEAGASPSCLEDARVFGFAIPHGHGVWSHPDYEPTRYELVQIRMAKAVFWGPSALWLHGVLEEEPEVLWIAVGNNFPRPRTLEHGSVVIRTRNLEKDVEVITPLLLELRVHSRQRAQADVAGKRLRSVERPRSQTETLRARSRRLPAVWRRATSLGMGTPLSSPRRLCGLRSGGLDRRQLNRSEQPEAQPSIRAETTSTLLVVTSALV